MTKFTLVNLASVNPAQNVMTTVGWTKSVVAYRARMDKPIASRLQDTGLWGHAIRERKPAITNDYKGLVKPTKEGHSQGHVYVRPHMNAPVGHMYPSWARPSLLQWCHPICLWPRCAVSAGTGRQEEGARYVPSEISVARSCPGGAAGRVGRGASSGGSRSDVLRHRYQ